MVGFEEKKIALRYAQAFLNVIAGPFSVEECKQLSQAVALYRTIPTLLFYLQIPLFNEASKKQSLARVRQTYGLPSSLEKIDLLLLERNRIFLLPIVYQVLIEQSHLRAGRVPCVITSAQHLSDREHELCTQFVADLTGKEPLIEWHNDTKLIAGLRMHADTWLWENSLDARLRALAQTLLT